MNKLRYAAITCSVAAAILMGYEGKSNVTYLDLVQVPTICYGYTHNVKLGDIKTDTQCTDLLIQEVRRLDNILSDDGIGFIPPNARAAIISWMYNVGEGNYRISTLRKKLRKGDVTGACNELPRWAYAKGKKLRGLVNRRADEQRRCLGEQT